MDLQVEQQNKQYTLDASIKTYTIKATEEKPLLYNRMHIVMGSDDALSNVPYDVVINGVTYSLRRNEDVIYTTNAQVIDSELVEITKDFVINIPETPSGTRLTLTFIVRETNGDVTTQGETQKSTYKFVKSGNAIFSKVRKGEVTVTLSAPAKAPMLITLFENSVFYGTKTINQGETSITIPYNFTQQRDLKVQTVCNIWDVKTVTLTAREEKAEKVYYINKALSGEDLVGKHITAFMSGLYRVSVVALHETVSNAPRALKVKVNDSYTVYETAFKNNSPDRSSAQIDFVLKAGDKFIVVIEGGDYRVSYLNIAQIEEFVTTSSTTTVNPLTVNRQSSVIRLPFPPDQDGYSVKQSTSSFRRYNLKGGAGRYVRDLQENSYIVQCQWTLGPEKYRILSEVYDLFSKSMSPLEMYLYVNGLKGGSLQKCKCYFVPDTFTLNSVSGQRFIVSAQLEVVKVYDKASYKDFHKYGIDFNVLPYLDVGLFKHIYKGEAGSNAFHFAEMLDGVYNGYDNQFIPFYMKGIRVVKQVATDTFMTATLQFVMDEATDMQKRNLLRFTFGQYNHEAFQGSVTFANLAQIGGNADLLNQFVTIGTVDEYITAHKLDGVAIGIAKNDAEKDLYYRIKQAVIRSFYIAREMKLTGQQLKTIIQRFYEYE